MGVLKYKESAPNTYYHLYNRGNKKKEIFLDKTDYRIYLNRLLKASKKYNFSIIAYCLKPNHFHLIVKQNDLSSPANLMASVNTSYSMIFNLKYKTVGHLFQDRYKQKIIKDDQYILNLIAYIHFNPVNDKLCVFPKEYCWSSYLEYAGLVKNWLCDKQLMDSFNLKGQSFEDYIRSSYEISPYDAFDQD